MPTHRISIEDAPAWIASLKAEGRKAAKRGLLSAGHRLVQAIQTEIITALPQPPVDVGTYRAGWRADATSYGALVHNTAPHAGLVEDGVRAGSVKIGRKLIDALTEWVQRKRIGGGATRGGRPRKVGPGEARALAWAIAKSMQKRGIFAGGKGLGVLRRAVVLAPRFIREEVDRELRRLG